ncbi:MAG: response regulator [Pseudomonadota bacterium]
MDNWNVLLVDDEQEFASTLAERLTLRGMRVRTAGGGQEALRCISEEVPDIVVLDLMMPGMNGLTVLNRIKEDHPAMAVILLTGMGSVGDGMKGMQMGAFDYLMKPLDIEGLVTKIREALSKPV